MPHDPGWLGVLRALDAVRMRQIESPEHFVRELDWHAFLWVIRERLDTIYPADLFESETYGVLWASEHGGSDIDPGVRWATLLRLALKQLEGNVG